MPERLLRWVRGAGQCGRFLRGEHGGEDEPDHALDAPALALERQVLGRRLSKALCSFAGHPDENVAVCEERGRLGQLSAKRQSRGREQTHHRLPRPVHPLLGARDCVSAVEALSGQRLFAPSRTCRGEADAVDDALVLAEGREVFDLGVGSRPGPGCGRGCGCGGGRLGGRCDGLLWRSSSGGSGAGRRRLFGGALDGGEEAGGGWVRGAGLSARTRLHEPELCRGACSGEGQRAQWGRSRRKGDGRGSCCLRRRLRASTRRRVRACGCACARSAQSRGSRSSKSVCSECAGLSELSCAQNGSGRTACRSSGSRWPWPSSWTAARALLCALRWVQPAEPSGAEKRVAAARRGAAHFLIKSPHISFNSLSNPPPARRLLLPLQ